MSMWAFMASWFTPTSLFLFLNLMIGTIFITSRFGASRKPQHQLGTGHPTPLTRAPSLIDRVKSINFSLYKYPSQESETDFLHPSGTEFRQPDDQPQLHRAPSLLDRVKSINFLQYKFPQYEPETELLQPSEPGYNDPVDPPQLARAPSLLERVKSIKFSSLCRSEQPAPETKFLSNTEPSEQNEDHNANSSVGPDSEHKPQRSKSETKKLAEKTPEKMKKSASAKSCMGLSVEDSAEIVERRRPATARVEKSVSVADDDQCVDAKADDFINRFKQQLRLQRLDSLLRYKEMLKGK